MSFSVLPVDMIRYIAAMIENDCDKHALTQVAHVTRRCFTNRQILIWSLAPAITRRDKAFEYIKKLRGTEEAPKDIQRLFPRVESVDDLKYFNICPKCVIPFGPYHSLPCVYDDMLSLCFCGHRDLNWKIRPWQMRPSEQQHVFAKFDFKCPCGNLAQLE